MKRMVILSAVLLVSSAAAQDLYKCQQKGSGVLYQNMPCADGKSTAIPATKAPTTYPTPAERALEHTKNRYELREAARNGIGMGIGEFLRGRRLPDKTHVLQLPGGVTQEQWIYKFGNEFEYYYFKNNKLTAVQF